MVQYSVGASSGLRALATTGPCLSYHIGHLGAYGELSFAADRDRRRRDGLTPILGDHWEHCWIARLDLVLHVDVRKSGTMRDSEPG